MNRNTSLTLLLCCIIFLIIFYTNNQNKFDPNKLIQELNHKMKKTQKNKFSMPGIHTAIGGYIDEHGNCHGPKNPNRL